MNDAKQCRHGDNPNDCISCSMLAKRPDKKEPEAAPAPPRETAIDKEFEGMATDEKYQAVSRSLAGEAAQPEECMNCGSLNRSDRSYVDVGIKCTNPWHEGANKMDDPNKDAYGDQYQPLSLCEWLQERLDNCVRMAANKSGSDRDGWLEDAGYFRAAIEALRTVKNA